MAQTSAAASLYFIALMTFGNYVLFNLLVAILVEGFSSEVSRKLFQILNWCGTLDSYGLKPVYKCRSGLWLWNLHISTALDSVVFKPFKPSNSTMHNLALSYLNGSFNAPPPPIWKTERSDFLSHSTSGPTPTTRHTTLSLPPAQVVNNGHLVVYYPPIFINFRVKHVRFPFSWVIFSRIRDLTQTLHQVLG